MAISKSIYEELVLESNDQKRTVDIRNGTIALEGTETIAGGSGAGTALTVSEVSTQEILKDLDEPTAGGSKFRLVKKNALPLGPLKLAVKRPPIQVTDGENKRSRGRPIRKLWSFSDQYFRYDNSKRSYFPYKVTDVSQFTITPLEKAPACFSK